uniref:Uncharacterized protein n=1 Tax=Anguilla anguilla TaxID=7936 RepID=A0A0E9XQW9_ANGAN
MVENTKTGKPLCNLISQILTLVNTLYIYMTTILASLVKKTKLLHDL